jgi:hypothetical protein
MDGRAQHVDAPGGVLDHGQDVSLRPLEQIHGKEVARDDRLSLGTEKLRP